MANALDIFQIAKANATTIQSSFDSLIATMPPAYAAPVREFAEWVEINALISINVKLYVLVELINGNSYQNIYEWAQEQSRLSARSLDDVLRERLREHYQKRVTFDRSFNEGEKFRYGALNAGGIGLSIYEPYCLILTRVFQDSNPELAYLAGDSLKVSFSSDGHFDESLVRKLLAPKTHCHILVAKERAREIPPLAKEGWPELVASSAWYCEVIFLGEVSLNTLDCVRVSKKEYDLMWNMAFDDFGRKLEPAERAFLHDFVTLRKAEVNGKIRMEVLP